MVPIVLGQATRAQQITACRNMALQNNVACNSFLGDFVSLGKLMGTDEKFSHSMSCLLHIFVFLSPFHHHCSILVWLLLVYSTTDNLKTACRHDLPRTRNRTDSG